jgi:hypothetical protein
LLAREALETLGLPAGATPEEIKAAHRDLVKVWHPDRFGSDARLREKAEEKLKQINQAYTVLRNGSVASEATGFDPSSAKESVATVRGGQDRSRRFAGVGRWVARSLGMMLLALIAFVIVNGSRRVQTPKAPEPPAAGLAQDVPAAQAKEAPAAQPGAASGAERPKRETGTPFRVTALSEAQTAELQEDCAAQPAASAAHQKCVGAQLDLMEHAAGAPDLSALDGAERESMESTCAAAKRVGVSEFDRCLRKQIAELVAEPARPDLAALGETDRNQIEAACQNAKEQRGPAAYNRCRVRLVQLLAQSK